MILEAPTQRVESIAYRDMRVFVSVVYASIATDDDFATRKHEINPDFEEVALPAMAMSAFHRHPARRDAVVKLFQLLRTLADARFECRGRIHMSEGDLEWDLHRSLLKNRAGVIAPEQRVAP